MVKEKINILLFFFCFTWYGVHGQNLVPNGGFEEFSTCPDDLTHKDTKTGTEIIPHWVKPSGGTADYFNRCTKNIKTRIPDNQFTKMEPKEGDAYMGLLLVDEVQEYIQVELVEPLQAEMIYSLSFWVAHANKTSEISNSIGAVLSPNPIQKEGYENLNYIPSVQNPKQNFLYEQEGDWIKLEFDYTATGGEKFLTIGNFYNSSETKKATDHVKGTYKKWMLKNQAFDYCYYLIDDVQLELKESMKYQVNLLVENNRYFNNYANYNLVQNPSFEYHPKNEFQWDNYDVPSVFSYNWMAVKSGEIAITQGLEDPLFMRNDEFEVHSGNRSVRMQVNGKQSSGIASKLSKPMKSGERYLILFFMKVSAHSNLASPQLEIAFSDKLNEEANYPSQIQISKGQISDDGWVKHEFAYEAKGGEQYMLFGNLQNTISTEDNVVNGFKIKSKENARCLVVVDDFLIIPTKMRSYRRFGTELPDTINVHVYAKDEEDEIYLEKVLLDALMRIPTGVFINIYGPDGVLITEGDSRNFSYFNSELRNQIKNIGNSKSFILQKGHNIILTSRKEEEPNSDSCINVKIVKDFSATEKQLRLINNWFFPY